MNSLVVGPDGVVYAVEFSHRSGRDLVNCKFMQLFSKVSIKTNGIAVATTRTNIVPVRTNISPITSFNFLILADR
jgi:fibrillarin-like rRNA methylase